jgi:Ca2+-binding RTX toxin-like protein
VRGTFTLQEIGSGGDVSNLSGDSIESDSDAHGVTGFLKPEDIAWDPNNPNVCYFVTTNTFEGNSRLYQATFEDITNPTAGGTIVAVLDGDEGQRRFDNLTVGNGKVVLQEDPGDRSYVAKIWEYNIATDSLTKIASFDPDIVTADGTGYLTDNEESSGVLDVTHLLGDVDTRVYLLNAQLHVSTGSSATLEPAQFLAMRVNAPGLSPIGGTSGNDTLSGTSGSDSISGGAGTDALYGREGDDVLNGGSQSDVLYGGDGSDTLIGGTGNDVLYGNYGADSYVFDNRAGTGFDRIPTFSSIDRLLTTVALSDPDQDGQIDFGSALSVGPLSSVDLNNSGDDLHALYFTGMVTLVGVNSSSYGSTVPF